MSSAVPRTLSGPGWFCALVSGMKRWLGGTKSRSPGWGSSAVPAMPSDPMMSGSSAFSGTITVAPLFTVWSTPWSKNWPKKVKIELYGGDSPTSVVTFGMNRVWPDGTQPAGAPSTGGLAGGAGAVGPGWAPGVAWVRPGEPAAPVAGRVVEGVATVRV